MPEQQHVERSQNRPEAMAKATPSHMVDSILLPSVALMLYGFSTVSKIPARTE